MKKRLLATLLALCLIVGLFPAMALADGVEGDKKGTCGATGNEDKVTWALTENEDNPATYTLTISGTGDMKDFAYNDLPPWNSYAASITNVVIESGVTTIGARSFANCSNLDISTGVTIPNTVTKIGSQAFLMTKASGAFTIPANVTEIGQPVFNQCDGLTGFVLAAENSAFRIENNVLFSGDGTTLMCYPDGKTDSSYRIPDGVTAIGASAIVHNENLQSVDLNGVTELGNYAFDYTVLTSVDTTGITSMGTGAFRGTSIIAATVGEAISENMFMGCSSLASVTFAGTDYREIPGHMFQNCSALTSISLPDSITKIGTYAFNATALTSIKIPDTVTEIGTYAFYTCNSLASVELNNGLQTIGDYAFGGYENGCSITTLSIPGTVTSIGQQAFKNAKKLESIIFDVGDSTLTIGTSAFENCAVLKSITGKRESITFAAKAFYNCGALEQLAFCGAISFSGSKDEFSGQYSDGNYNNCPTPNNIDLTQVTSLTSGPAFVTNAAAAETNAMIYYVSGESILSSVKSLYTENYGQKQFAYAVTNGGTFASDAPFSAGTLAEPDKTGYIFGGWFDNAAFTGDAVTTTPTAGQTYYAKWTQCTDHEEESQVTTPATCDTEGVRTYTCKKCGATIRTETIPALGHSYGNWSVTVTPTTTAAGQLTRTCARNSSHTETKPLPALNTTEYTYTVTKQAGVYEAGEAEYTITVDGQVITITVMLPALPLFPPVNPTTPSKPTEPDQPAEPDTPVIPGTLPFVDVSANDWYYEDVAYVYAQGIMTGSTASTFAPNNAMTRAMVWTVLGRMSGASVEGGTPWYALAQAWAVSDGVSDGTGPNDSITREQLVTMLYRQAGSPEVGVSELALLGRFTDGEAVSAWAEEAMAWAVSQGILTGDGDLLNPQAAATRAQVAAILARYCENLQK